MTNTDWSIVALLCDSVQVADGKLYLLGGGWTLTGPGPFVHGLAVKVGVPWDQSNRPHTVKAVLQDEDGASVKLGEDNGEEITFETTFEVGRPPAVRQGSTLDVPIAVNFGPIQLPAGASYSWELSVDGHPVEKVSFQTRPQS